MKLDTLALGISAHSDFSLLNTPSAYFARISSNLLSDEALLEELSVKLQFPGYFGNNWNALWDVLRDFSWTNYTTIVIWHEDLPTKIGEENLKKYLSIIRDAVLVWRERGEQKLIVAFPDNVKTELKYFLKP